ncbi:MAG: orotidine 5'-phosphate decarboxylase, partial [Acidimicrobiia bacterium]
MTQPPILVALDTPTASEAHHLAADLVPHVAGFKVGLELLMGPGPSLVTELRELGRPIFVDAKLHDIPNTVEAAARRLGMVGARWVTVHASGGRQMMEAAAAGLAAG